MDGSLLPVVIGPVSALVGVWLGAWMQRRVQRDKLQEDSLATHRDLLAGVLIVATEWAEHQETVLPAMRMMAGAGHEELLAFLGSETVIRNAELREELRRSLTRARLSIADEELAAAIRGVSEFTRAYAEVSGVIFANPGSVEHVGEGLRKVHEFQRSLRDLEQLAAVRLRSAWDR